MALFGKKSRCWAITSFAGAESSSFCIFFSQHIRDGGCGTTPASVLYLAELVESPIERPFQAPLIARELGEGVSFLGVGVDRASEEDLVSVLLIFSAPKRLARFRMRSFVGDVSSRAERGLRCCFRKSEPLLIADPPRAPAPGHRKAQSPRVPSAGAST